MVSSRAGLLALLAAAVLTMSFPDGGRADTTLTVSGIGTQVGAINTHVDSVTYSAPELVQAPGFGEAYEVRGSVSGVGWGGAGIVARARRETRTTSTASPSSHAGASTERATTW